jgi:tRNA(Ile)-lysidine synthase
MIINKIIEKQINSLNKKNLTFLLAVSGGSDSQVLLKSMSHVAKKLGHKCYAMGINHGLRLEAGKELDLAESLATSMNVSFFKQSVIVEKGPSVQAKAREVRYEALFNKLVEIKGDYIVTAHHLNDRAETVLMKLIRGGSLNVLPIVSGQLFRPLLEVPKEDIMKYIKRWNISYAEDPSNKSKKYLRSRIRYELIPLLQEMNPSIINRLNEIGNK